MNVVCPLRVSLIVALAAGSLALAACDRNAPPLNPAPLTPTSTPVVLLPPAATLPATPALSSAGGTARPSLLPLATRTPFPTPAQTFRYVVQLDDTLSRIAARFKTSAEVLMLLNNLPGDLIVAGQQLTIPGSPPTATSTPRPPTATATPRPTPRTYVVRNGDSLSLIAKRYGTTVRALMLYNGLRSEIVVTGQVIRIP